MKIQRQVILIAGASSGMGRVLALQLARQHNHLILFARRTAELEALKLEIQAFGHNAICIVGDACNENDTARCVRVALHHFKRIDLAILNVGAGPEQRIARSTVNDIRHCMDLNYLSLVNFLPPLITQMRQQKSGTIAHTNSLAGFIGLPLQGPYSAAKSAARLLMDSCRIELQTEGLRFVSLYPGFVKTSRVDGYEMPAPFAVTEQRGAALLLQGLESGRNDYLFPGPLSWLIRIACSLPKSWTSRLLQRLHSTSV